MIVGNSIWLRLSVLLISAVCAFPCSAADNAVLRNGFSIRHERREVVGEVTRLYVTADGSSFVDVPSADIDHFEQASDLPVLSNSVPVTAPVNALPTSNTVPAASSRSNLSQASPFLRNTGIVPPAPSLEDVVASASGRYRLDPDLVNSVIKAESDFNPRAVSPKGAQGLMQLMPGTATNLGVPNAFDPRANVEGGTKYLRELLERYNFDLVKALAAYNAGPQRVEQFHGIPPYYETRAYVARIVRDFNKKKAAQQATKSTAVAKNAKSVPRTANSASRNAVNRRAAQKTAGQSQASGVVQARNPASE